MRIEQSIDIEASPDVVWPVMSGVERWHEWTASITSIQPLDPAGFQVGARYRVLQPKFPPIIWQVTSLEPGRSFEWVARSPGMVSTGRHVVVPRPGGGSTVTLAVLQEGLLGGIIGGMLAATSRRYVDLEANGLKRRCEEIARAGGPG